MRCLRSPFAVVGDVTVDADAVDGAALEDNAMLEGKWTVGAGDGEVTMGGCETTGVGVSNWLKSAEDAMSDARPCIEWGRARDGPGTGGGPVVDSVRARLDVLRNKLRGTGERSTSASGSGAGGLSQLRMVLRASAKL